MKCPYCGNTWGVWVRNNDWISGDEELEGRIARQWYCKKCNNEWYQFFDVKLGYSPLYQCIPYPDGGGYYKQIQEDD